MTGSSNLSLSFFTLSSASLNSLAWSATRQYPDDAQIAGAGGKKSRGPK